eukprot:GFUD01024499.1.p1 GENE.GFUD01024499.1~~GFUD01024499.1.p1  ORF type:complete len:179 (+),score=37.65 GFUD01024499.1:57-539(+)
MFLRTCPPLKTIVRTHLGYIPFEGRLGPQLNNMQKFILEHKKANLQPVTKVTYTFDPIKENYHSLRNFMFFWNTKKVKATNVKLLVKTEIVDDRRDPKITFDLNDGRQLEIRSGNLTELEIATIVNSYLLPLVKEEEATDTLSKGAAAAAGGKGGKKGRK